MKPEFVFSRMLGLNPNDNQGVRFLIEPIKTRHIWREDR